MSSRPLTTATPLAAVLAQVERCLAGHPLALEVLEDYREDAARGRLAVPRLRGFLHGLFAAGVLSLEDYCEADARLDCA